MRQHRARDVIRAEDVQLELRVRVPALRQLRRTGYAETGVVDEDIDSPLARGDLVYDTAHLRLIRDVRAHMYDAVGRDIAPGYLINGAARRLERSRRAAAYAAAAACDYSDLVHVYLHLRFRKLKLPDS